ncbi:MAG: trigger factor [Steroidobacteraceae bacterium]
MQVSITATVGLERKLDVAVPAARVNEEINSRLREIARTARLKGFRPGKAPFEVVKRQYGGQVQSDVVSDLLQRSFADAVSTEKLRPATDPRIEALSAEPGADLRFTAVFEVMPEFKVNAVDSIELERPEASVTDADLEAMLDTMRKQRPDYVPVDRPAIETDKVSVDFEGRIDGELFQGGSGEGISFVIGAGRMLPEFEAGVKGAKAGETRTVEVKFPDDYGREGISGKTAQFAVAVKSVEEQKLPELNDEFCAAFGVAEGGVEALRTEVRRSMERELTEAVRNKLRGQVLDALHRDNPIDVPKGMVAEQVRSMQLDMARRMGIKDVSQLPAPEGLEEPARRRVALGLIVGELIRAEGIKVERERVAQKLADLTAANPNSEELRRQYLQNADAMRQIERGARGPADRLDRRARTGHEQARHLQRTDRLRPR